MKSEKLFELLCDIDDDKILGAQAEGNRNNRRLRIGFAACFAALFAAVIAVTCVFVFGKFGHNEVIAPPPEDGTVVPLLEIKKQVPKQKILYWEEYKDKLRYSDGGFSAEVSIAKDVETSEKLYSPVFTNNLGEYSIARKLPMFEDCTDKEMKTDEWEHILSEFELTAGISYYDFLAGVPDKWGYPELSVFNGLKESGKGQFVLRFEIPSDTLAYTYDSTSVRVSIRRDKEPDFGLCDYLGELYEGTEIENVINGVPITVYEMTMSDSPLYFVSFNRNGVFYEIETKNISDVYLYELLYGITLPAEKRETADYPELPVRYPMDYRYESGEVYKEMYFLDRGIRYVDFESGVSETWLYDDCEWIKFSEAPMTVYSGNDRKCVVIDECDCKNRKDSDGADSTCRYESKELDYSESINGINVNFYCDKSAMYEYKGKRYHIYSISRASLYDIRELLSLILISQ